MSGLISMLTSNFCGFVIRAQDFPPFWMFLYWMNPLHYALEGITVTQFYKDHTPIDSYSTDNVTAEDVISEYYSTWKHAHRGYNAMALLIFIVLLRCDTCRLIYVIIVQWNLFSTFNLIFVLGLVCISHCGTFGSRLNETHISISIICNHK